MGNVVWWGSTDWPTIRFVVAVTSQTTFPELAAFGIPMGIALALTFVVISYVRTRVRRLRDQELLIEQLTQSRARETEANRMKSDFVTLISHELRTPLNAILGFSELLQDIPDHPDNPRRASLIHSSRPHLLALLNTLLDLAKIEAGRMVVCRTNVDLMDVMRMLLEVHRSTATKKSLSMELNSSLPVNRSVIAYTDRTKYVQVLNNVLHNAVKFTSAGGVRIDVSVESGMFVVQVRDAGCGIEPDQLPRIFDRFSTASKPGSNGEEGSGLGLCLSRDLMQLLGGSIDVSSCPGTRTQVCIRLPDARILEKNV